MRDSTATLPATAQAALRLRAIVAALGETVVPPWWKTDFLSETGFSFLGRLYPRSTYNAAVHAAGRAACDAHDKATGRSGVFHLFRLPDALEVELYHLASSDDAEFVADFRASLRQPELLLGLLSSLCASKVSSVDPVGPTKLSIDPDHIDAVGLSEMASMYRVAFSAGRQAFPYFLSRQLE